MGIFYCHLSYIYRRFSLHCFVAVFSVVPLLTASGPATLETHNKARDWATAVVVYWPGMKHDYALHKKDQK